MALTPNRIETAANWVSSNPILAKTDVTLESDTGVVKAGDGILHYTNLPIAEYQETSAQESAGLSDETGTGAQVFATSPTLVTPILGVATATSITSSGVNASAGVDTSSGATVTAPTVSSGVAFTPSTTKNAQVTFQFAAATGSYTLTYLHSTGAENTLGSAVATLLNESALVSFMVPKGWKVVLTLTTVTLTATHVTTF